MRKTAVLTLATLLFALPGVAAEVRPEVRARAAGILDALKKIEAERNWPAAVPRNLTFTEAEFNAYVVCRLDAESEPFVKAAEFKLLADDHIEGRITIDLGDQQTSGLLPKRQDLLFSARVETRDGRLTGEIDIRVPYEHKGRVLRNLAANLGLAREQIAAIGDSASDIKMFREATVSIAFRPSHPSVSAAATHTVEDKDLGSLAGVLIPA